MVASIATVFFFDGRSSGPVLLAGFVAHVCHEGEMSGGPAFGTPSILNYKMSHPVYINYVYYIYENSVYLIA